MQAQYASYLGVLGMLVLAGWIGARLTWLILTPTAAPVQTSTRLEHQSSHSKQDELGQRIANAHLFGAAPSPEEQAAGENAPETSLDLSLIGIASGSDAQASRAIIASGSGQQQKTYAVGAKLPGGAVIRQILPDRIVLARNGHLETLRMPVAKPLGSSTSSGVLKLNLEGHPQTSNGKTPRLHLANNRNPPRASLGNKSHVPRAQHHGIPLSRYLRTRAVRHNGKLQGYRVYPGPDNQLFKAAGLKAGDLVTAVNGIQLDSTTSSMKAIAILRRESGPITLTVIRHHQPRHITINPGG